MTDFGSIQNYDMDRNYTADFSTDFLRVAAAVPHVRIADVDYNVAQIRDLIDKAHHSGVQLLVFPELSLCGYTCADLLAQNTLLTAVEYGIATLTEELPQGIILIVGAPIAIGSELYNCAVALRNGNILGIVPKTYLPNYKEFYEQRWFRSSLHATGTKSVNYAGQDVPFGTDLLLTIGKATVSIELCEDLWVPTPPSSQAAINGANVIVNLSASNELIGKNARLRTLISQQSSRCIAAYVYASAGFGESSTDVVFAGNALIANNGSIVAEGERFSIEPQLAISDIDLEVLNHERRVNTSFGNSVLQFTYPYRRITTSQCFDYENDGAYLPTVKRTPFVPQSGLLREQRCTEIVNIQTHGLMQRLNATCIRKVVVGISGGLDSTLALLVAVNAFDKLGIDRKQILGVTMPGLGTTDRTHSNAQQLMDGLGITTKEVPIAKAVAQHFADIEHDPENHDVTYENSQARERTQILMDLANQTGALVLGTGDLSELALGWATFNGDHISMYHVNCSIPKTLVQHLVDWFAKTYQSAGNKLISKTLFDILDTPISPELTPATDQGEIQQKTEDIVGPYELHDFFLYHFLRNGSSPAKIYFYAWKAFEGKYPSATIKKWITVFFRRFFLQQFKRSCMPDGPKVGSISLSPRGDWRMSSDSSFNLWLNQCTQLPNEL